jgi:hypothetical protein
MFSIRSVQSGYKERELVQPVQLRIESPAVKKGLYVCCSYSETVIITVARI